MRLIKTLVLITVLMVTQHAGLHLYAMNPFEKGLGKLINSSIWNQLFLHYMNMGKGFCGKSIHHTRVLLTNVDAFRCNRVFTIANNLTQTDINEVKNYMQDITFGWWVPEQQTEVRALLERNDFVKHHDSDNAMIVNLKNYDFEKIKKPLWKKYQEYKEKLLFKKATTEDEIDEWIETSASGLDIVPDDHAELIQYLLDHGDEKTYSFYTGYFDGVPASTCLMIQHTISPPRDEPMRQATLHLVSTIPAFRRKTLATMISLHAMAEAKENNFSSMLLMCNDSTQSLYHRLGFQNDETYTIYIPQNTDSSTSDEEVFKDSDEETVTDIAYDKAGGFYYYTVKPRKAIETRLEPVPGTLQQTKDGSYSFKLKITDTTPKK